MSKLTLNQRIDESEEYKKVFNQEDLILAVTESICEELKKREWSNKVLAEKLGCSPAHVTQLLNGSRNMTLRTLADISTAFDLHASCFVKYEKCSGDWKDNAVVHVSKSHITNKAVKYSEQGWSDPEKIDAAL